MSGTIRFENEYDPDRPMIVDRYPAGFYVFQIGVEELTAHPVSLSPSQVGDLVAFLGGEGGR